MRKALLAVLLVVLAAGALLWFRPGLAPPQSGLGQILAWMGAGGAQRGQTPGRPTPGQQAQGPARPSGAPSARPPAPVETVAAELGRVVDRVEALGALSANESVPIALEVGGRIRALRFREGDMVEAGATLVELDAAVARAELSLAQANLSLAEDAVQRSRTLVQRGAGTQVSLEQATAQLAIARANVAAAEARLERLSVDAPFAGVVGLRNVSVGAIIQPGAVVAILTSLDPIKVDFGVPELLLGQVRVGQEVDVRVDAMPDRIFRGRVDAIDPVVEASGRALRLRATVPNRERVLRPGLFARISVTTGVRERAVTVPEAALIASPTGQDYAAYRVRDGRAELAEVVIGRREGGRVEIAEGLAAGDLVVVAGQAALRDGAAVAPVEPPARPATATTDAGP